MQNNVLVYLEETVKRLPDKVAFANETTHLTFQQVYDHSQAIGTFLHLRGLYKEPVVVFMKRQPKTIAAFLGVMYSGNYYVPLDEEMPKYRMELILNNLNPRAILCDEHALKIIQQLNFPGEVFLYDTIIDTPVNSKALNYIRERQIDTDAIYVVFTSGSTGIPKGVVASHRSVLDYIENLSDVLEFNEDTVFGMQVPLYFDACLKEIYPTLKFGATTYLMPKSVFMFPIQIVDYLNEYKINTVCWVVSALTMISSLGVLEQAIPKYLHTIAFGSEVFPIKQFNLWKSKLPQAKFTNLYGPTEATGMSCFYKVDREFSENEVLPIGRPFKNTEILLLSETNQLASKGEIGELCIRGTALTHGYYGQFDKTNEVFVQNPLNQVYPELIYRTGDLAKYNEYGELIFVSRKDYQIKHMGHRIELGEIEAVMNTKDGVQSACCIYDSEKEKIVLYYVGTIEIKESVTYLRTQLPRYMIPNHIEKLDTMPLTPNGKIDRVYLKQHTLKVR